MKKERYIENINELQIEIEITNKCNLKCSYCFERALGCDHPNESISNETVDIIIDKIENIVVTEEYKKSGNTGVRVVFWGGEPSVEHEIIKKVYDRLKKYKEVTFFMYTNGVNLKPLYKLLFIAQRLNKFTFQISYDGSISHARNRLNHNDESSLNQVLNTMQELNELGIEFSIKSVITLDDIDNFYNEYKDCEQLSNKYSGMRYMPSIIYDRDKPDDYYKEKIKIFNDQLKMILENELERFYDNKGLYFGMFYPFRPNECVTGSNIIFINLEGKIYKCHRCNYNIYSYNHTYSNIFNDTWFDDFLKVKQLHEDAMKRLVPNNKCKNCFATVCLRCNVERFEYSKKEDYFDKFYDLPDKVHCEIYQLISKAKLVYEKIIGG